MYECNPNKNIKTYKLPAEYNKKLDCVFVTCNSSFMGWSLEFKGVCDGFERFD